LLKKGRLADACAAFDESHRLDPALGALLNLAECTLKLEQHARAWMLYTEVLAWSSRSRKAQRADIARERLAVLRPKVALLVIDAPPGVTVQVDRQPLVAGQTLAVDPGAHVVEWLTGARSLEVRPLTVRAGETMTLSPVPAEPPAALPPTVDEAPPEKALPPAAPVVLRTEPESTRPMPSKVVPWALVATGSALMVAGAIGGGWSLDVWNRGEAQRTGGQLTVSRETYQTASVLYPASLVGLGLGVTLLLGRLVWWWLFSA
jgi:hypothetical protein